ncbi:hypothetical protein QVD17_31983 [Tagetes erecta]|uniref:RRM domain-containing protein n=1 Tax=Tagetes erecta TaxID=13708 RepID=A0AAD8NP22_TARER|nr:hypothetical protein QVD17_31983 [Tagetes erecta]
MEGKESEGGGWQEPRRRRRFSSKTTTSFFITRFPENYSWMQLQEVFQEHGRVCDVFVPNKKTRGGYVFSFVRFVGVQDVKELEGRLNAIILENRRISANVALYIRDGSNVRGVSHHKDQKNTTILERSRQQGGHTVPPLVPVSSGLSFKKMLIDGTRAEYRSIEVEAFHTKASRDWDLTPRSKNSVDFGDVEGEDSVGFEMSDLESFRDEEEEIGVNPPEEFNPTDVGASPVEDEQSGSVDVGSCSTCMGSRVGEPLGTTEKIFVKGLEGCVPDNMIVSEYGSLSINCGPDLVSKPTKAIHDNLKGPKEDVCGPSHVGPDLKNVSSLVSNEVPMVVPGAINNIDKVKEGVNEKGKKTQAMKNNISKGPLHSLKLKDTLWIPKSKSKTVLKGVSTIPKPAYGAGKEVIGTIHSGDGVGFTVGAQMAIGVGDKSVPL